MRVGAVASAILTAGMLGSAACSTVLGVDADRYVAPASDAGEAPPPIGADWSCLNEPRATADPNQQVAALVTVLDELLDSTPLHDLDGSVADLRGQLPGVTVKQCSVRDAACAEPITSVNTDETGGARFDLPGDFSGYFDISRQDLIPATFYPGALVASDDAVDFTAYALAPSDVTSLIGDPAPTKILGAAAGVGIVMVAILDCRDQPAQQVTVSYTNEGPETAAFYFANGLLFPAATAKATDDYGQAAALNMPAGRTLITASRLSDQKLIGTASVDVRAGGLAVALIRARAPSAAP